MGRKKKKNRFMTEYEKKVEEAKEMRKIVLYVSLWGILMVFTAGFLHWVVAGFFVLVSQWVMYEFIDNRLSEKYRELTLKGLE